jgi:hypothetical protein
MEQILTLDLTQEYVTEKGVKVRAVGGARIRKSIKLLDAYYCLFSDDKNRYVEATKEYLGTCTKGIEDAHARLILTMSVQSTLKSTQLELF